jgi:DNA replication ATP-dependent helicase Dna2
VARAITTYSRDQAAEFTYEGMKRALVPDQASKPPQLHIVNIRSLPKSLSRVDVRAEELLKVNPQENWTITFQSAQGTSLSARIKQVHFNERYLLVHSSDQLEGQGIKVGWLWPYDFIKKMKEWLSLQEGPIPQLSPVQDRLPVPAHVTEHLRASQLRALQDNSAPYLWGPPGTGKTYTVGFLAWSLVKAGYKVLVVAPTNAAVDQVTLAIDDAFRRLGKPLTGGHLIRAGTPTSKQLLERSHLLGYQQALQEVLDEIKKLTDVLTKSKKEQQSDKRPSARKVLDLKVEEATENLKLARQNQSNQLWAKVSGCRILACTVHGSFNKPEVAHFCDSHRLAVIYDEAAMVARYAHVPLAALLSGQDSPIGRLNSPPDLLRVHFAGDPMQLAPIGQVKQSDLNAVFWQQQSLMEEVLEKPSEAVCLKEQSRMSEPICQRISGTYYQGQLTTLPDPQRAHPPLAPQWPEDSLFLVPSEYSEGSFANPIMRTTVTCGPKFNEHSVAVAVNLIQQALDAEPCRSVLWLSPFAEQSLKIQTACDFFFYGADVRAGTVHTSQGSQADLVIFDPVNPGHSWLKARFGLDLEIRRLLNVAISRARTQVIVLASSNQIRSSPLFHEVLHCLRQFYIDSDGQLLPILPGKMPPRIFSGRK